jgi:hypothetical protein
VGLDSTCRHGERSPGRSAPAVHTSRRWTNTRREDAADAVAHELSSRGSGEAGRIASVEDGRSYFELSIAMDGSKPRRRPWWRAAHRRSCDPSASPVSPSGLELRGWIRCRAGRRVTRRAADGYPGPGDSCSAPRNPEPRIRRRGGRRAREAVKRADDAQRAAVHDVRADHGGLDALVAEELRDRADVDVRRL